MPTLHPVSSSNITALGYDADSEVLHIQFHGGALWEFTQITPEMHASLVNAPSIGGYFQRFIRGRFNGRKLADAAPVKTDATLGNDLARSIALPSAPVLSEGFDGQPEVMARMLAAGNVQVLFQGKPLTGFAPGEMIKVEQEGDDDIPPNAHNQLDPAPGYCDCAPDADGAHDSTCASKLDKVSR